MARLVRKVYKYGFLVVIVLLTGLFYFLHAYDYLSLNRPGIPGILVVEGWVPDEVLLKAKVEFVKKNTG